jgi:polysaccharide export outer membrane protein
LPPGLAPGDQLTVHMYDFPELGSGIQVHVGTDGSVQLPYAGSIPVQGVTPEEFGRRISESLKTRGIARQPNVTVDVVSAVNLSVNVIGHVVTPKVVPLYAPAPLSYVLAQVGGVNGLADRHLTILHHSEEPPTSVEYDAEHPTSAALNTIINPGDVLSVSTRGVYFVGGEVNHPGVYPMGGALSVGQATPQNGEGVVEHMTLLEALAQAGGITTVSARSKLHILRTVDGKRVDIQVDQVKLSKGEVADPLLQPNDMVYLPPSYWRLQTNNLFATALTSMYAAIQLNSIASK